MSQLHIMHILTDLGIAGLQKGVVNLANRLDRSRFKTSICCLEVSGVLEERLVPGTEVIVMHRPPRLSKRLPLRLASLFDRARVDIVHTHNFNTFFYGALGAILSPRMGLVHGEHGDLLTDAGRRDLLVARRLLYERAYAIHTVSQHMAETVVKLTKVSARKVIPIANGVELDLYSPGDGASVRPEFGAREDDVVVGAVGRLVKVKNYPMLLRAAAIVHRHLPRLKLVFIGDGPERPHLESLAQELGIRDISCFLGDRSDVPNLLRGLDILALTSVSEGMSNTILEAMAAGLPVVATAVGGNPELVRDGATGFLVPLNDDAMLAERLMMLATDRELRRKLGLCGRRMAEEEFSIERMIARYTMLYEAVSSQQPISRAKEAILRCRHW